ncbi:MAG: riboflavin synthase [Bdellovibrionales bacterium]
MFTGIIQDIGDITAIGKNGDWTVTIAAQKLPLDRMPHGASVSCSGICLTVTEKSHNSFKVQVSAETLSRTTALHWKVGTRLNLESAMRMGDEFGGHLVSGHVDGVARVVEKRREGNSVRYVFEVPAEFAKFIASKGSITLDGVSMTVNETKKAQFGVNVIPHTLEYTTLDTLEAGSEANFEVDLIARYAARLMSERAAL